MEESQEKGTEQVKENVNIEIIPTVDTPFVIKKKKRTVEKPKKKRNPIGRKPKIVKDTKIREILEVRGLTRKDLESLIKIKDPENPMSPDAISRIVNGSRLDYKLSTLYRLCRALDVAPNTLLNWEEEVIPHKINKLQSEESQSPKEEK